MLTHAPWNVIFGILAGASPWLLVAYICLCVWLKRKAKEVRHRASD